MKPRSALFPLGMVWLVLVLMVAACAPTPVPSKPLTKINSPASNMQMQEGKTLTVESTSTDTRGIVQVDLLVDGFVVHSDRAPGPQASYTVLQKWTAIGPGSHTISVEALNNDKVAGDRAAIVVQVTAAGPSPAGTATQPAPTAVVTRTATGAPTAATTPVQPAVATPTRPAATATFTAVPPTIPPSPIPCRYIATFVDETIPDGTPFAPGAAFNKTWRVRNDGTCVWAGGFQLVAIDGERMTSVTAIAVSDTAPGGVATLTIAMTAPAQPGGHGGRWQLRTPAGAVFGPYLSVNIVSLTPTPVPCIPVIASFEADRTTINRGEATSLRWGKVDHADRVEIDNGIGGVGTPGDRGVAPQQTTTYTLSAYCGGNVRTAQVQIIVNQPAPTPGPQRLNLSGSWSAQDFTMELQEALGCGALPCAYAGRWIKVTTGAPEISEFSDGRFDGSRLTITLPSDVAGGQPGYFEGTTYDNGASIVGHLRQGNTVTQITFRR